jgi:hypothetical protein
VVSYDQLKGISMSRSLLYPVSTLLADEEPISLIVSLSLVFTVRINSEIIVIGTTNGAILDHAG